MPRKRETFDPSDPAATHTTPVRVRYAETDQMGRAHHSHYFVWFELARSEFCRARGFGYGEMEAMGLFLPIREAHCTYLAPALYDEEIAVTVFIIELRRATLRAGYIVTRGETRLAEGETVSVLMNRDGKLCAFPPELAAKFQATG